MSIDGEVNESSRPSRSVDNINIPGEVLAVLETTRGKAHAISVLSEQYGDEACRYVDTYFATEKGRETAARNARKAVIAHNHDRKSGYKAPMGFPVLPPKEETRPKPGFLAKLFGRSSN